MIKSKIKYLLGEEKINNVSLVLAGIGIFIILFSVIRWGGIGMYDDPSQMLDFMMWGLVFISWSFIHHRNIVSGRDYDKQLAKINYKIDDLNRRVDMFTDVQRKMRETAENLLSGNSELVKPESQSLNEKIEG